MTVRRLFRWKAIVPLSLFLAALAVAWMLLLDRTVERGIERTGAMLVGARVDVASADVRVADGAITVRGLQVANPDAPMSNLLEAAEIIADLRVGPLLERRVVVETLAVRGVRFNTPRTESGALETPPPESGRLRRELARWADQVRFPPFSLAGLEQVVDLEAIRPDSLETLALARRVASRADSVGARWQAALAALDPRPDVDSARALIERLRAANPLRLGPTGIANLVSSTRATTASLAAVRGRVTSLDSTARGDLGALRTMIGGLADARAADLAAARGMLRLPSLAAPEISPALFGDAAVQWVRPVLYWLQVAEDHLPPGLQPRRVAGGGRARRAGTTARYPEAAGPAFLVEFAEAQLALGGTGSAAGQYLARLTGLSSAPALSGPTELRAVRDSAARGPRRIELAATLRHGARPIRDSVHLVLEGLALPELPVPALGARLVGSEGRVNLELSRSGDSLDGRLAWTTGAAQWLRADTTTGTGIAGRLEAVLWRALDDLRRVDVAVRVHGPVRAPRLEVQSNVGAVLAASVQRELGRELAETEARIRARVDALVADETQRARDRVAALEAEARERIAAPLNEVRQVEEQLRAEIQRASGRLPGFRLPGAEGGVQP